MKKLSVVLATFNEEENLPSCLASIKELAHEIVIVDGTSTDNTVEIAKRFDARVIVRENPKNFHINKQIAIDEAKCDWILQLDADEHVSKTLGAEIKNEVLSKETQENGFWIPRKNYFLGKFLMKGGQYPDYTLRLYRRGKGGLPQKDVHEQAEVQGEVGYLKEALLHYPYSSFSFYLSKWNRYNSFEAGQIRNRLKHKHSLYRAWYGFLAMTVKPLYWFLLTYFRHKGFTDSWQGFVFSLFSSLRFPVSYIKYLGGK